FSSTKRLEISIIPKGAAVSTSLFSVAPASTIERKLVVWLKEDVAVLSFEAKSNSCRLVKKVVIIKKHEELQEPEISARIVEDKPGEFTLDINIENKESKTIDANLAIEIPPGFSTERSEQLIKLNPNSSANIKFKLKSEKPLEKEEKILVKATVDSKVIEREIILAPKKKPNIIGAISSALFSLTATPTGILLLIVIILLILVLLSLPTPKKRKRKPKKGNKKVELEKMAV
ncbi:MAG: hypothetical protein J7L14_01905, partial [Candidatus Diapherotrites archaeon]|nr:hypothetical protein [Candidatus Diapherotrites archaeon]